LPPQPPRNRPKMASGFGQGGPKIGPRRLQDLPKTSLNHFFMHLRFRLRFWSVLGVQLRLHVTPLGHPRRPPNRCKKRPKITLPQDGLQDRSKTAPDPPKRLPRPPRHPPRTRPNAPQETPKPAGTPQDPPTRALRLSYDLSSSLDAAPKGKTSK
jgi:hypothetical protein